MLLYNVYVTIFVATSEMTTSRTVTLQISDWAKLEEIRRERGIIFIKDAIAYAIRADWEIIDAKRSLDHESPIKLN